MQAEQMLQLMRASMFPLLAQTANSGVAPPALAACHVHAALVLLDGSVALRAGFGVGQDPVEVLTLSTVLGDPLADSAARNLNAPTDRRNTCAGLV
jgi:hypothetical protein